MNADEMIKAALKEVGTKEAPAGSNRVKYNTWYYKREVSGSKYPWCVVFLEWLFRDTTLLKRTASASDLAIYFKNKGRFFSKPQKGDIVFFNFHTPDKIADHVGIVESVNANGTVNTIEGNTSVTSNDNGGAVMKRVRISSIVGYGRPMYSNASAKKESSKVKRATLSEKAKSRGDDVIYLKKRLTSMGFGNLDLKSDLYNKGCGDAIQYLQVTNNLTPDRICGPKTWALIENK